MNPSLSEDSVAETALAKKNSDGKWLFSVFYLYTHEEQKNRIETVQKEYERNLHWG
jgi:hypothetical protein